MRSHRELENLPAVLAESDKWGLDTEQLETLVKKISVKFEWSQPRPAPRPISFLSWLKKDPKRCAPLWFALVEHSDTHLSDPRFEHFGFEEWLEFANIHGVYGHEFHPAWRAYRLSQRQRGITLVN